MLKFGLAAQLSIQIVSFIVMRKVGQALQLSEQIPIHSYKSVWSGSTNISANTFISSLTSNIRNNTRKVGLANNRQCKYLDL